MSAAVPTPTVDQPSLPRQVILHVFDSFRTAFNAFGIAHDYRHCPSYDPDSLLLISDLSDTPRVSSHEFGSIGSESCEDRYGPSGDCAPPWPWVNMTIWRLMSWKLTGSNQKSNAELTCLVKEVIQAPDFKVTDLAKFHALTESRRLNNEGTVAVDVAGAFSHDGWKEATLDISIPIREKQKEDCRRSFIIPGLMYQSLVSVIQTAFSEPISQWFHFTPFKCIWKSALGREQRVFDELYLSDAWNKAHDEIQKQKRMDNCQLERVVAGLMFWSDSTHLAQFGHSSAWPIYLFFRNLLKYIHASPAPGVCHPIAFIPPVSSLNAFPCLSAHNGA